MRENKTRNRGIAKLNLNSIFDYLTDFMVLCSPDFEIIESNTSANVILGKGESIVGLKCYEIFRVNGEPCSDCPLSETIESGMLISVDTYDERFGEYFEERTHPILTNDGELQGFVIIGRNVSKMRELENKFAQAKKLAAIGQISSGVAHDFNNVLTGVIGRVQIMKKQITDPTLLKHLEIIETAALDGAATVRRMQDFTRKREDVDFELIDLKQLIEDVVALTRPKWREATEMKGIIVEVILDLTDDLCIIGNNSDIRNALTNLIFNAVDAMPDGGVLSIRTEKQDNNVIVQVKDTGIGMTEETKERIFDPFFTTKGVKGTGMGMSEVYGVVKRHDGHVNVESEVGKGSMISLTFPIMKELKVEVAPEREYVFEAAKILSIDDEEYVLDVIKELLVDSGHQVSGFTSAEKGIEEFKKTQYDIVITDLGMPEMSGQEVAEKIKAINDQTPVILLSGWSINLEEEKDLAKVIDFTITKPFSVEGIQEVVSKAIYLSKKLKGEKLPEQLS